MTTTPFPVTKYGNIDVRSGVPEGFVHNTVPFVARTCKANGIPYVKALVETVQVGSAFHPKLLGVVIRQEDEPKLTAILAKKQEAERKREERIAKKIRAQFPNMPEGEELTIVKRAWEKRSGRVGRQLSVKDAILPAVIAHIRHQHTEYDNLQKTYYHGACQGNRDWLTYEDRCDIGEDACARAREKVSNRVTEILCQWQGKPKPTMAELIIDGLCRFGESNLEEIQFRFDKAEKPIVANAVMCLAADGDINVKVVTPKNGSKSFIYWAESGIPEDDTVAE